MRIAPEEVKEAIVHPDQDVREAALAYFARAFSPDPTIMPLAIEAIERYGFDQAFETPDFLEDLSQTDATVRWLIEQLREIGAADEDDTDPFEAYVSALISADVAVLQRFEQQIQNLDALDVEAQEAVRERLALVPRSPAELWEDLEKIWRTNDDVGSLLDEEFDVVTWLAEALARHPDAVADKVVAVLSGAGAPANQLEKTVALRLAGLTRLEAAIPFLVKSLNDPDDWLDLECGWALTRIGSAAAVLEIGRLFGTGDLNLRMSAAFALQDIHSDLSVQTLLERLRIEPSARIQGFLLQSLLRQFATEAVELARQYILSTPLDSDVAELRAGLLTACKVMGERFPEYDAWLAEEEELRQQREILPPDDDWPEDDEARDEWDDDDHYVPPPPPTTIMGAEPRAGRNDPCPCGSGKKYKKCCLNKGGLMGGR